MASTSRLQDLVEYPREDLDVELKGWLDLSDNEHKADLAKAILALANHGGGYVLIGFTESGDGAEPDEGRPKDLFDYDQDDVNGIVQSFADPPFQCEVHIVERRKSGNLYPVIVVPGGHGVPIRSKRDGANQRHVQMNTYYTRLPGPKSAPIDSAREWDKLINRCVRSARENLLDDFRNILEGSPVSESQKTEEIGRLEEWFNRSSHRFKELLDQQLSHEKPSRYQHGTWTATYTINGISESVSLAELKSILREAVGRETGWPVWWYPTNPELRPYPKNGSIECWLKNVRFEDAAHSDFWKVSPDGRLFLLRGYQEDDPEKIEPGTAFDVEIPSWRIGECLLHANRVRALFGAESKPINFRFQWNGLNGRRLVSMDSPTRHLRDRRCNQDTIRREFEVGVDDIQDSLPELIHSILKPVYEHFDFFELPMSIARDAVSGLRKRM